MAAVKKINKYHFNYASVKSRGVNNKVYTLTIHKNAVKKSGFEFSEGSNFVVSKDSDDTLLDERFAASISRSKNAVIQLAANNPWDYFVTLNLKRDSDKFDAYDLNSVKKVLLKFFANYGMRSGAKTDFKYLLIPEMHKDGAWHFHGLLMGINPEDLVINEHGYWDFVPYRERFGFFSLGKEEGKATADDISKFSEGDYSKCGMGKITDLMKCANYIAKYISKDMLGTTQAFEPGMHLYFASKGLKKDTVIVVGTVEYSIDEFIEKGFDVFENEHCAKVHTEDIETAKEWVKGFVNNVKHQIKHIVFPILKRIKFISFYIALSKLYMHWVDYAHNLPEILYDPFKPVLDEAFGVCPEYDAMSFV